MRISNQTVGQHFAQDENVEDCGDGGKPLYANLHCFVMMFEQPFGL